MNPHGHPPRPRIIANLAMSADGKIDSAAHEGAGFSSRLDRARMDEVRAQADALVVGAGTVRAEDPPLHVRDPALRHARANAGRAADLVVVVVSRTGALPPSARFLREPAQARILAVPPGVEDAALEPLSAHTGTGALEVFRAGGEDVDIAALVAMLAARGCRTVLVEGGGELVSAFLDADLLDELRLTLCPTLIGGAGAPTPVGGAARRLADRRLLQLREVEHAGDELFLRYEIHRTPVAEP